MNKIIERLVNAYTVLVLAEEMTIEQVPETYALSGTAHQMRELVELEVARRTIAALG